MQCRIAVLALFVVSICSLTEAGTLTILERESSAANSLFAGSGGTVQTSDESDDTTALTGPFSFSDSNSVAVSAASAAGSITVADDVVQSSARSLSVTASRTASGAANHISGTGNAFSNQNQELRVRFIVNDDDARYTLTGSFDPGVITTLVGEAHSLSLYRPFTANVLVDVDSAATLDESGLLIAGRTYEFRVRLNDRTRANASEPSASDASSFDLQFNVTSIPEPTTGLSICIGSILMTVLRRKPRAI